MPYVTEAPTTLAQIIPEPCTARIVIELSEIAVRSPPEVDASLSAKDRILAAVLRLTCVLCFSFSTA